MLRQRILTALALVPLVVAAVLYLPSWGFAVAIGLIVVLGMFEFARLGGITPGALLWGCQLAVLLLMLFAYPVLDIALVKGVILVAAMLWLAITALVFFGRPDVTLQQKVRPLVLISGALFLVVTWLAMVRLHRMGDTGPALVMFLLLLIWSADTGAYFAGKQWGSRKLAPFISPGKTREGMYGAVAAAAVCATLFWLFGTTDSVGFSAFLALCVLTTVVSIAGDLWESVYKRRRGVKDSGQLLPGHGGILDRVDSLLAAAPFFTAGILILEGVQ